MAVSSQNLLSTLYDENKQQELGTITPPGFIDAEDQETAKWYPYYSALMPITHWLINAITPLIRIDFMNEVKPGLLKSKPPRINVEDIIKESGKRAYARGFGSTTIFGNMFPNDSSSQSDLNQLHAASSRSRAPLIRKTKTGYKVTATTGAEGFLSRLSDPVVMGTDDTMSDLERIGASKITSTWNLGINQPIYSFTPDMRSSLQRLLGNEYFDVQNPYHRTFSLGKKFTDYLKDLLGGDVTKFIVHIFQELQVNEYVASVVLDEDAYGEDGELNLQMLAGDYLLWLDLNLKEFDLISPPMVAGSVPRFLDRNNLSKALEIYSLSETSKFKEAILPSGITDVAKMLGNVDASNYSVMDCFIDGILSIRSATIHLMLDLPKESALLITGNNKDSNVDEYYLAQIVETTFNELVGWEPYNKNGDLQQNIGDQAGLYYSAEPVDNTIALLSKRKVPTRIGTNEEDLAVDSDGLIYYLPRKLNDYSSHKEAIAEYFNAQQFDAKKRIFGLRDPFDIEATRKVYGKEMNERPRPNADATHAKPLFVDWSTNTLIGVVNTGCIVNMLDLNGFTPLMPKHTVNYRKAVLYPVKANGYGTLSYSSAIVDSKINVSNAITDIMGVLLSTLSKKCVDIEKLKAFAISQMSEMVAEVFPNGNALLDESRLNYYASLIAGRWNSNDPISALHDPTYAFHTQIVRSARSEFGSDENMPEAMDDHLEIEKDGSGFFLTLEKVSQSAKYRSLFGRILAFIITECWNAVQGRIGSFMRNVQPTTGLRYYGTLKYLASVIKNPPSFTATKFDTSKPVPLDYKPEPLPGSREGYTILAHQLRVDNATTQMSKQGILSYVLNVDAGGGKTHSILNDAVRKLDSKEISRPLIVCPGYLVKNYIEDAVYIYEGRINVVPIVTLTKNYNPLVGNNDPLGLDGLQDTIEKAPPNTVFVTSYDFLSNGASIEIPCGTELKYLNAHVELLLSGDFDYVAADESHELRNPDAIKSESTLAIFYRAKYRVLATGTFLNTTPADIPSQARLLDPTVFGSQSDFIDYYGESDSGTKGNRISRLREGRKEELVQSMRNTMGYIQVQRKEWTALLPERKDAYHIVTLDEQSPQWKMYQAVLTQVLKEIEDLLKQNKSLAKADSEGDEEAMETVENLLNPYLARLEMLLVTPYLDPDFEELMKSLGEPVENNKQWISPAVERAIHIMETHIYGVSTEDLKKIPKEDRQDEIQNMLSFTGAPDNLAGGTLLVDHIPATEGKILVFCNYNSSVDAVYDALPPNLKKMAIRYRASHKDEDIFEFKNNPDKRIMIGIQTSLATGHNLQQATRLIRLENVWSPGELEQGESRINRPDPKNMGAQRSCIYYDFVAIDGSIAITKLARLISRIVVNLQVNEFGNPMYKDVPHMQLLTMNLSVIRNNCWLVAPSDEAAGSMSYRSLKKYLEVKRQIDNIQREDARRWLANYQGIRTPVEVDSKDVIDGSKILANVPPIPGQAVAQADKFNLLNVGKYETVMGSKDLDLVGMRCYTPEGDGEIVSQRGSKVQILINGAKYSFDRLSVNLYVDIDEGVVNPYTRADIVKSIGIKDIVKIDGSPETISKTKGKQKTIFDVPATKNVPEDAPVKVIPTKSTTRKVSPVPQPTEDDGIPDDTLDIVAATVNGALGLMVSSEDADLYASKNTKFLKSLGFHLEPDVWYAEIPNKRALEQFIAKMEAKFNIPDDTLELLNSLVEAFSKGRKRLFDATRANTQTIREYWLMDYRRNAKKDPDVLVPVPYVEDDTLYLVLDMSLPSSKRAKRLKVENVTWDTSGGLWLKLYPTKASAVQDLKTIQTRFSIADKDTLKDQIRDVNIVSKKKRD